LSADGDPSETGPYRWRYLRDVDGLRVSESPWGPEDEIGRLNWVTDASRRDILARLNPTRVFDLSVEYSIGMPCYTAAGDPKFEIWMTHTPQGSVVDDLSGWGAGAHTKYPYCGDAILMYTHCGTHIDTLNHVGHNGCFWNGWTPDEHLGSRTWAVGGARAYPPIVARGVLLDVAGAHGVDCLPESYLISAKELRAVASAQKTNLQRGDIVIVRTGRMSLWPDASRYLSLSPGIGVEAARYLCEEAGAMCVGSDTVGLEVRPPEDPEASLPVHAYMFATAGAQIIEVLDCQELAREKIHEFAFMAFPLKLSGATGAPCRPIAIPIAE
jgi:kynurenine formamidase